MKDGKSDGFIVDIVCCRLVHQREEITGRFSFISLCQLLGGNTKRGEL